LNGIYIHNLYFKTQKTVRYLSKTGCLKSTVAQATFNPIYHSLDAMFILLNYIRV